MERNKHISIGNDNLTREYEYINKSTKDGSYNEWYSNKQLKKSCTYNNGKINGLCTEWYKNGLKKSEKNYINGDITLDVEYRKGILFHKMEKQGNVIFETLYCKNGNIEHVLELLKDPNDGNEFMHNESKYFWENTNIKKSEMYNHGKLNGDFFLWYENGNIKTKYTFFQGSPTGEFLRFYENGNLKEKGHYENGYKHGSFERYHMNGTLEAQCIFDKDKILGKLEMWSDDGNSIIITNQNINLHVDDYVQDMHSN